jgi:hypothetical protein
MAFYKAVLQGSHHGIVSQPLDGEHLRRIGLHGQGEATPHRTAIHSHGAGAAHPMFAPNASAFKALRLAQKIAQVLAYRDLSMHRLPIDLQLDVQPWLGLLITDKAHE